MALPLKMPHHGMGDIFGINSGVNKKWLLNRKSVVTKCPGYTSVCLCYCFLHTSESMITKIRNENKCGHKFQSVLKYFEYSNMTKHTVYGILYFLDTRLFDIKSS